MVWLLKCSSKTQRWWWLQHTCLSCQRKGSPSTWVRMPSIHLLRFSARSPFGADGQSRSPQQARRTTRCGAAAVRGAPGEPRTCQGSPAWLKNTVAWYEHRGEDSLALRPQMAAAAPGVTGSWWQQHVEHLHVTPTGGAEGKTVFVRCYGVMISLCVFRACRVETEAIFLYRCHEINPCRISGVKG